MLKLFMEWKKNNHKANAEICIEIIQILSHAKVLHDVLFAPHQLDCDTVQQTSVSAHPRTIAQQAS